MDTDTRTISRGALETALDTMRTDPGEVIRDDYKGRGTDTRGCLGLAFDDERQFMSLLIELMRHFHAEDPDKFDDYADALSNMSDAMRTDGMGLGVIYYFPGWSLVE